MDHESAFHILIVDDEKDDIELAASYLQEEGYRLSFSTNGMSVIEGLERKNVDLILLDIHISEIDGFSIAKALKRDPKTSDIPIMFITAQTDIKDISKAFEAGGVDYIVKPFNDIELKARVRTHLENVSYLRDIKEKQAKLAQLSITDPLTKLYNFLYFDTQLKKYQIEQEEFWFVYIKINRFDTINALYGFTKANKILKMFAQLLQESMPKNSTIARLYGVGFGVLTNNYELKYMQKLYRTIEKGFLQKLNDIGISDYSIVFYHVNEPFRDTEQLYKKVQNIFREVIEEGKKYEFVTNPRS
ncbi:MAG: response regulator [Epsilonproteobacteria bacterium]|nr:response regulator [Campylobacterota bacterium]